MEKKDELIPDPFENARKEKGHHLVNDQDDPVNMILGYPEVRKCAHDWQTFQSGDRPGRIVVPSEVHIRDIRQIPFEVDPPEHTQYRDMVEEWFRRPLSSDYTEKLTLIVISIVDEALEKDQLEVVNEFSLPLQSKALTLLLDEPINESETWIGWGTHVFRSKETNLDASKATELYDYLDSKISEAKSSSRKNMYTLLLTAEFDGRKLTDEEIKGFMILTFAGGRDTVINFVTNAIAYLAQEPEAISRFKDNRMLLNRATEEFARYFSPLTHMGRVVTEDANIEKLKVNQDSRISLCWASANRDENIFEDPNEIRLDRKKNPHVAFGFSHHKCLGAHHARQVMKVLLKVLSQKVKSIEILDEKANIEQWGDLERKVGYDKLVVKFSKI